MKIRMVPTAQTFSYIPSNYEYYTCIIAVYISGPTMTSDIGYICHTPEKLPRSADSLGSWHEWGEFDMMFRL